MDSFLSHSLPSPSLLTLSKSHSLSRRVSFTRLPFALPKSSSPFLSLRSHSFPIRCCGGGSGGGAPGGGRGGGGGGDGSENGDSKVGEVSRTSDDVSTLSPDVIVLDVRGMSCGGCAAKVKRILESQPQVSSASVNLATETAVVWLASEAKVVPNWQQEVGEVLAKQLTNCGFETNLRGLGEKEGDVLL